MTHALLLHSPAIDAGDPNFNPYAFNPPLLYDQRDGPGFPRIVHGRIDIGAFESKHPDLNNRPNQIGDSNRSRARSRHYSDSQTTVTRHRAAAFCAAD